jgi:hypothetical protein
MFIGHFAVGFAAKRYAPRTSLALLLAAPLLSDLLWPWFLLFGWERVRVDPGNTRFVPLDLEYFPWSHSLLMCMIWATAFALLYHPFAHYWRGTVAIWLGVMSHWVLDWITHRPDMPIYPGGQRFGLGLWNSVAGTRNPAKGETRRHTRDQLNSPRRLMEELASLKPAASASAKAVPLPENSIR